jgi:iron complex transport system ATP-binding protein
VSLAIEPGQRWVVLGPNGSGKTTLLSIVGARRHPTSGTARVFDVTFGRGDVRPLHDEIGHASHTLTERFPPGIRVMDVVLTGTRGVLAPWFQRYGETDRTQAEERLAAVGCRDLADRVFASCSQGERQRVLLARAMVGESRLLVLDEPAAGLDLPAREALIGAIEEAVRDDHSRVVVIATHHLEEIPPSATHAVLLRDRRVVALGPIEDVITAPYLATTFGLDLEITRRDGRWSAFAPPASDR